MSSRRFNVYNSSRRSVLYENRMKTVAKTREVERRLESESNRTSEGLAWPDTRRRGSSSRGTERKRTKGSILGEACRGGVYDKQQESKVKRQKKRAEKRDRWTKTAKGNLKERGTRVQRARRVTNVVAKGTWVGGQMARQHGKAEPEKGRASVC